MDALQTLVFAGRLMEDKCLKWLTEISFFYDVQSKHQEIIELSCADEEKVIGFLAPQKQGMRQTFFGPTESPLESEAEESEEAQAGTRQNSNLF